METPASVPSARPPAPCPRWDRSAFRLHTLAMNPELALMASRSTVASGDGALPVHWMQLDPVLAPILRTSAEHEMRIARLQGLAVDNDARLSAGILVRLGVAGETEPRGVRACASFAMRLLWRSAALTIRQHRDMERAAQARRPGRSSA